MTLPEDGHATVEWGPRASPLVALLLEIQPV